MEHLSLSEKQIKSEIVKLSSQINYLKRGKNQIPNYQHKLDIAIGKRRDLMSLLSKYSPNEKEDNFRSILRQKIMQSIKNNGVISVGRIAEQIGPYVEVNILDDGISWYFGLNGKLLKTQREEGWSYRNAVSVLDRLYNKYIPTRKKQYNQIGPGSIENIFDQLNVVTCNLLKKGSSNVKKRIIEMLQQRPWIALQLAISYPDLENEIKDILQESISTFKKINKTSEVLNWKTDNETIYKIIGPYLLVDDNKGNIFYFGKMGAIHIFKRKKDLKKVRDVDLLKRTYKRYWSYYLRVSRRTDISIRKTLMQLDLVTKILIEQADPSINKDIMKLADEKPWLNFTNYNSLIKRGF